MKYRLVKFVILLIVLPLHSFADTFVAHCRNYPPELIFEDEQCIGPVPDMVTDILSELGHSITWVEVPWIRSIREAMNGNVDLLIRHSMTEERKSVLLPIQYGLIDRKVYFYKSPLFKSELTSYEDLKTKYVGAIRGNFYSPKFSATELSRLLLVGETEQLIGMLELGRIDVAVSSESHSRILFEGLFEKSTFVDSFMNPMFISIPLKSSAVKHHKTIASLVQEYRESGKIKQYFERYGFKAPK